MEYSLLAYFFSFYIKNKYLKKSLQISTIAYFIFCVYDFSIEKVPGMPFLPASVEHILLLIFIVYYFYEVLQESVVEPIYQKAIFWICVAFIINSSGNFFLFLYGKNSYNDESFQKQYTLIYVTVTVIKNLLLCISILIKEKKEDPLSNSLINIDLDSLDPFKNRH